ncbi:MAG: hypothetical protein V1855_00620 [bacterium]
MKKTIKSKALNFLCALKFKIIVFVCVVLYVVLLFHATLSTFRTEDKIPTIKTIGLSMQKEFQNIAAKVRAGIFIKNFPTFDFTNNRFVVDALVWFEFNKHQIMRETIDKFSFQNGEILECADPVVHVYDDKVLALYNVLFQTKTDLDFSRFPLEDHRVSIVLTNEEVSPSEMYFDDRSKWSSLVLSDRVFISNWVVHNKNILLGYKELDYDQFNTQRKVQNPTIVFSIDFKKVGIKNVLIIFVPIFAAVFLALFIFLMSFNNYIGKITLAVTSITALLGYRFVIQKMMPVIGYLTITDALYLFFLFFVLAIFVFQALLVRQYMFLMEKDKLARRERAEADVVEFKPRDTELMNTGAYYGAVLIFVAVVTFIVLR